MILRDKYGYPVETIFGKPVTNLVRRILYTNIRRTLAGEPLNEDEMSVKIKPTQSNVALAHSAFAGKSIYGDAAFPSVTIAGGAPPGVGPGYSEDSAFSINHAALASASDEDKNPSLCPSKIGLYGSTVRCQRAVGHSGEHRADFEWEGWE